MELKKLTVKELKLLRLSINQELKLREIPKSKKTRIRIWHLYALELEGGNYYIGMTTSVERRFLEHKGELLSNSGNYKGSKWCHKHKPIRLLESRKLGAVKETYASDKENEMTMEYMIKYGKHCVRGGSYCSDWAVSRL